MAITDAKPSAAAAASAPAAPSNAADARYTFDADALEDLRKRSPWKDDAKWFSDVSISPTAIVKMVSTYCVVRYSY